MKEKLLTLVMGVLFGVALSRIGFTSWDEVHNMFVFADLRLLLTFMFAVALLVIAWWAFRRAGREVGIQRQLHKGTIAGGVLFGIGWALSGACPSIGLVQLGEGQLGALWTLVGMLLGNLLYAWAHPRFFGWSTGSCLDE